ncbi:MAG: HD domain-containing protein [Candidatus Woesearchaeota archaeon]|jgi:hypothetical protein
MLINDTVYGLEEINEQVLLDLINSKSIQRLKGIAQFGIPRKYDFREGYSRFDHSIGVLILLRRLGAGLDEQIAGLLHDVSHTAFSHVVDGVLGDPIKEDYQDMHHEYIIEHSEIPTILDNYGIDYKMISAVENFSLLEKEAPSLCADRIDYTLRELRLLKKDADLKVCLDNLINNKGQIVFKSKDAAKVFFFAYQTLQEDSWASANSSARYMVLTSILKKALSLEIILKEDFWKDDKYIIDVLERSEDNEIIENLNILKNGFDIKYSDEGIELKTKFRYVDPEVLINNEVVSLSKISSECKTKLDYLFTQKNKYARVEIIKK